MSDDLMSKPGRIASSLAKLIELILQRISNISAVFESDAKVYSTRRERLAYSYKLKRIALFRSAIIGGIASAIPILILYNLLFPILPELDSSRNDVTGWNSFFLIAIIVIISVIITLIELFFLYLDTVRYAGKLNVATQRKIEVESEVDSVIEERLPLGLTRAAIGLGKDRTPRYGIDPMRGTSKLSVAAKGAAFQAQAFVLNMVVKRLLRRVMVRTLGRSAPRALAEWILVPIYMAWNVVGTSRIMDELIQRANGLEQTEYLLNELSLEEEKSEHLDFFLKQGLSNRIEKSRSIHPNIEFLILKLGYENLETEKTSEFSSLSLEEKEILGKFLLSLPLMEGKGRRLSNRNSELAVQCMGNDDCRAWTIKFRKYTFKGVEI